MSQPKSQGGNQPENQPLSITKKQWEVNGRDLFKGLGKIVINAITQNWVGVATDSVEVLTTVKLVKSADDLAALLIFEALGRAIWSLLADNQVLLVYHYERLEADVEALGGQVDLALGQDLKLDSDFFKHPKQSPVLEAIKPALEQWLERLVRDPQHVDAMVARIPAYFVYALHEEWRQNSSSYAGLEEWVNTPFLQAAAREQGWATYRAWLQKKVEEPMFLEAFGLKQVYVDLCAYYTEKKNKKRESAFEERGMQGKPDKERIVVDLKGCLTQWLKQGDRLDAIRLLSGGPGSGKSSFAKMWAAELADQSEIPVLYVPLHLLSDADLIDAVGEFVAIAQLLRHNPLDPEHGEERLLLILDGLDELAMQGKIGAEAAQTFVKQVQSKVTQFNSQRTRLQVVISGREAVIQASNDTFLKEGQILQLLPYFVTRNDRKNYVDKSELLKGDRRQDWWKKYGIVTGQEYKGLPPDLNRDNLVEITAQPLLNYLVALSYQGGRLQISEQSNLNEIYGDLLTAIYQRGWEDNRQHPVLAGVDQDKFERILEEVALSSWHGNGRTTTVKEIEMHCTNAGMQNLLEAFQEGAKTGVTRLLTVFYFRQAGGVQDGEKTFEFTHKSFGEYLTARRVVREAGQIARKLQQNQADPDEGWNEKQALLAWARLCGATVMDEYLFRFVCDEVRLNYQAKPEQVQLWQETFCRLIEAMLRRGLPMELLTAVESYGEKSRQARNAEEAILAMLNACARCTNEVSDIRWQSPEAFGTWIAQLQGQSTRDKNVSALSCLGWLNLQDCILSHRDFYRASLNEAILDGAILDGAILDRARLDGASLDRARLDGARLDGASLIEASLAGASLAGASLIEARLAGARLAGARLDGIIWDENTQWNPASLTLALNVPQKLKQQLGLK